MKCVEFLRGCGKNSGRAGGGSGQGSGVSQHGSGGQGKVSSQQALWKTLELENIEIPKTFAAVFSSPAECPYHDDGLFTARQVMSDEQLIAINENRNTKFKDKQAKNPKARRTTGDGTVVLTHILQCHRKNLHCRGRLDGAGCDLCAKENQQQLVDLMQEPDGFKLEQLMELAGLSVATAFVEAFPTSDETPTRVVVVCGPGNNGGDGLVAARHLHHFGYPVTVVVPKPGRNPYFRNLEQQCRDLGINVLSDLQAASRKDTDGDRCGTLVQHFDVVIDAMFGFSFKGAPRPPFDDIIAILNRDQALPSSSSLASSSSPGLRILSVDIPSGWDVEAGDLTGKGLRPDVLVSLTAPKLCAKQLSSSSSARTVRHFLGGRFVPPHIRDKYGLVLPKYPGASQCVELKDW